MRRGRSLADQFGDQQYCDGELTPQLGGHAKMIFGGLDADRAEEEGDEGIESLIVSGASEL